MAEAGPCSRRTFKQLTTPWPHYACDWSLNSPNFFNVALGSFLPSRANYVQVFSLPHGPQENEADDPLQVVSEPLPVDYVATKVMWSPTTIKNSEYLAASGDGIYVWRANEANVGETGSFTQTGRLMARQANRRASLDSNFRAEGSTEGGGNPPAPVTSFDWSRMDPTLLVTASYDTTCTLWSLETGAIKTQLIAHDKEVFDVAFSPVSADSFVSVGADGSLRLFDVRTLDHSTILYESPDARPLLRVAWNPHDPNYISCFSLDAKSVIVMDVRMPSVPAADLGEHGSSVVAMRWSPTSSSHIMTCDSNTVRLWDLSSNTTGETEGVRTSWILDLPSVLGRSAPVKGDALPIQSVLWSAIAAEWIAVTGPEHISLLRI